MCPDRQILSVYFDNELCSPWKEKLEAHLENCPECRASLEAYRQTREAFLADKLPVGKAQSRVWEQFSPLEPLKVVKQSIWSRSLRIPVPVAAAAGLVLAAAMTLLVALRPAPSADSQLADMGMDVQGMLPVSDMASLLQYLGGDSSPDMVIITLPETTFRSAGEPKIIRAADYSGSDRSR
jgi:hypothetical protein